MLTLDNVALADAYTNANTLGPVRNCKLIQYVVANNSARMQVAPAGAPQSDWGPEILVSPSIGNSLQQSTGVRFKNAVAGQTARVIAQLLQPGDPIPIGGSTFTGTLFASGGVGQLLGELAYLQVTSNQAIAGGATTEGTATTIVGPTSALTFDGSQVIDILFGATSFTDQSATAGNIRVLTVFEDASAIGQIYRAVLENTGSEYELGTLTMRRQPSAGSHTYTVKGWHTAGANGWTLNAGLGGSNAVAPAFIQILRVT